MQAGVIARFDALVEALDQIAAHQRAVAGMSQEALRAWIIELNRRRSERGDDVAAEKVEAFVSRAWSQQLAKRRVFDQIRPPEASEPAGRIAFTHDPALENSFNQLLAETRALFNDEIGLETGGRYSVRLTIRLAVLLLKRIPSTGDIGGVVSTLLMLEAALDRLDHGETHAVLKSSPRPPNRSTSAMQKNFRLRCCLAAFTLERAGKSRAEALRAVFQMAQTTGAKFTESSHHKKFSPKMLERWVSDFRRQVRSIPVNHSFDELSEDQQAYESSPGIRDTDTKGLLEYADMLLGSLTMASLRKGTLS